MNTKIIALLLLFISSSVSAQIQYEEIRSYKLGQTRQLKIQLPRNYDTNTEKKYPILVVLDGDYLFEPIAGMADYFSYWGEMPEVIVVGVVQDETREDDTIYDEVSSLPSKSGVSFFEFLGIEMMPWLDKKYRTTSFRIVAGHNVTANFLNFYLMKDHPLFQGYISLSPDLSPEMDTRLEAQLAKIKQKTFYSLATGSEDVKSLRRGAMALDGKLDAISNPNLTYRFDHFRGATHYSLVGNAIPSALENIFSKYRPISKNDYKEVLLEMAGSPYDYLVEKYASIKELYGLEEPIRINDFTAVFRALQKRSGWEDMKKLGDLARNSYPETMLGNYYTAVALEQLGEPKKAMRTYQNAFLLDEISFLTKDLMLEKADNIKDDFGY